MIVKELENQRLESLKELEKKNEKPEAEIKEKQENLLESFLREVLYFPDCFLEGRTRGKKDLIKGSRRRKKFGEKR